MLTAIYLLFAHFVADFIFQTDEMAKNKSTSSNWLVYHTATYTVVMFLFLLFPYLAGAEICILLILLFCSITFAAHTITDYITSRISSKHWGEGNIGFAQRLHVAQLLLTYHLIFKI